MLRFRFRDRSPFSPTAVGATRGQEHIWPLRETLENDRHVGYNGEVALLDFDGIETANASYLKATVLWLLECGQLCAATGGLQHVMEMDAWRPVPINVYPVAVNLSSEVREELDELLGRRRWPLLEATEWSEDRGVVKKARLRGELDASVRRTLDLLTGVGDATATQLYEQNLDHSVNVTAWNNRLFELHRLRLARRDKEGKQWIYQALAEEVVYG